MRSGPLLAAPNVWHVPGHQCHELHIGVEWQVRHVKDSLPDLLDVKLRLLQHATVRLECAAVLCAVGHVGDSVTDVDLPARNIVVATFERRRLGQTRNSMFGSRVGGSMRSRYVSRDRTVIDNAASYRILFLHDADCGTRTIENAIQINRDCLLPLIVRDFL